MILLTHGYFLAEDEKEQQIMKPYVPLGILYLSAFLDQKGIAHEVFDSTFSSIELFQKYVLNKKPSLVAFYTNLMTKTSILRLMTFIKGEAALAHTRIVLGGPEIRYNAENYLKSGADALVVGEGEQTFFELCEAYLKSGQLPQSIDGIAYMRGTELVFTNERSLIKDINILPMPARTRVDLSLYGNAWKARHGYSMYSISTMRGCPYTCKWCSRAVYGGTYRRRSARLVVDEMLFLKEQYRPDRLWFVDDVFTINHKWLKEFHAEVLSRDAVIPYEIITRADRMNEEVIQLLKESGCFRVWIGAESGSQRIIDAMDRRVDVNKVREMIVKAKKAGMEAGTFIMLGYPGETKSDIRETINHLRVSKPSFYTITVAYPITGTPLYEEVNHSINVEASWQSITDRDYDFKRRHSKRYYQHAIEWVASEVNYHKTHNVVAKLKFKSKSILAQARMLWS